MPSERARPLVAFLAIAVVCALVISVNMLRHPSITTTAVEAAQIAGTGPRVEFGTLLNSRPAVAAPLTTNVLSVALRRPPAGSSVGSHGVGSGGLPGSFVHLGIAAKRNHQAHRAHGHPHGGAHHAGHGASAALRSSAPGHSGTAPGHLKRLAMPPGRAKGHRARGASAPARALVASSSSGPGHSASAPGHIKHGATGQHRPGAHGHGAHGHGRGHARG